MNNEIYKNCVDKNVYIVDSQDIYYFEDLKSTLINEIKRDTIENSEDSNIIESNFQLLERVYNCGYNSDFIIKELEKFGYNVVRVKDIQDNLLTLKTYWKYHSIVKEEDEKIKNIESLMNEISNYFND